MIFGSLRNPGFPKYLHPLRENDENETRYSILRESYKIEKMEQNNDTHIQIIVNQTIQNASKSNYCKTCKTTS